MPNIGIITAQGDLGLGFNEISVEEQNTIANNDKNKDKNESSSDK